MGKQGASPPAGVDPVALANAQTGSNIQTANALAQLNRVNQTTPWGSTTYTRTPGSPTAPVTQQPAPAAPAASAPPTNSDGTTGPLTTNQRDNGVTPPDPSQAQPQNPAASAPAAPSADPNAVDQWSQFTTLTPAQQTLLNGQQTIQYQGQLLGGDAANKLAADPSLTYGVNAPSLQTSVAQSLVPTAATAPTVGNLQTSASGSPIQGGLDFSGAPAMPQDNTAAQKAVVDALYGQQTSRLDPQWAQQQTQMETKLANQGIPQNSDAWNKAMTQFQQGKTDAYSTALNSAIGAGTNTLSQLSATQLANRQQGVNEATTAGSFANAAENQLFGQNTSNAQLANSAEGQGFGETLAAQQQQYQQEMASAQAQFEQQLAAAQFGNQAQQQGFGNSITNANLNNSTSQMNMQDLLSKYGLGTGSVQMPGMPAVPQSGMNPTDVIGAQGLSSNQAMAQYQSQLQNNSAAKGGAGSLLGTAAMAAMAFSDRYLKTDVQIIGYAKNGLPIYSFRYLWDDEPEIGLMAQDVERINPAAVHVIAGFKAVEYPAALA